MLNSENILKDARDGRMMKKWIISMALGMIILSLSPYGFAQDQDKEYLDFKTFQALRALIPELPEVFPAGGTTKAGHELWERGQLRVPVNRNFIETDLNQDGQKELTILIKADETETHHYILVVEQGKDGLRRLLFQDLGKVADGIQWNKKTNLIEIDLPEGSPRDSATEPLSAYIFWGEKKKGFEYISSPFYPPLVKANLKAYEMLTTDELKEAQVKFTYLGMQNKPIPGLIFFSRGSYNSPDLELFKPYYRPGIGYDNDGFVLESLMVNPEDMQKIVLTITRIKNLEEILERAEPYEEYISFSLSLVTKNSDRDLGEYFSELLLSWEETGLLLSQIKEIMNNAKPTTYYDLTDYLEMFGD